MFDIIFGVEIPNVIRIRDLQRPCGVSPACNLVFHVFSRHFACPAEHYARLKHNLSNKLILTEFLSPRRSGLLNLRILLWDLLRNVLMFELTYPVMSRRILPSKSATKAFAMAVSTPISIFGEGNFNARHQLVIVTLQTALAGG